MKLLSIYDPFSRKAWREFLNQTLFLVEHGLDITDVERALKGEEETQRQWNSQQATALNCPDCSSPMQLLPVNDSPSTQTGDDSKSLWLCRNCRYEKFSDKTVNEELEQLSKETENDIRQ